MDEAKRTLQLIANAFALAGVVIVVALSIVDFGEAANPDLAGGAAVAAAAFGAIGLLVALQWWSRAGETPRRANSLMLGFIVRVAVAEIGLLMGILGLIMTGSPTASYVGLGLFLAALALLTLGLRRVD